MKLIRHQIEKAREWWKANPQETGIVPVLLDEVEPTPAPKAEHVNELQRSFINSVLETGQAAARVRNALADATLAHMSGLRK